MIHELLKESNTSSLNLKCIYDAYKNSDGKIVGGYFKIIDVDEQKIVSRFVLEQMGGCNGICISRKVLVNEEYRGKGYGTMLCSYREKLAKHFGYSVIMCSVVNTNKPQRTIMIKNGWKIMFGFHNKRTNNFVFLYQKDL